MNSLYISNFVGLYQILIKAPPGYLQFKILKPAHPNQYDIDEIQDRFDEESHPC